MILFFHIYLNKLLKPRLDSVDSKRHHIVSKIDSLLTEKDVTDGKTRLSTDSRGRHRRQDSTLFWQQRTSHWRQDSALYWQQKTRQTGGSEGHHTHTHTQNHATGPKVKKITTTGTTLNCRNRRKIPTSAVYSNREPRCCRMCRSLHFRMNLAYDCGKLTLNAVPQARRSVVTMN